MKQTLWVARFRPGLDPVGHNRWRPDRLRICPVLAVKSWLARGVFRAAVLLPGLVLGTSLSHAGRALASGAGTEPTLGTAESGASRQSSLFAQSGLEGPTGLLHVVAADSAAPGTFRAGLIASYFADQGFLCPDCPLPDGTVTSSQDEARQYTTRLLLSLTPLEFLEGYGQLRYQTTSNSLGEPRVIQMVGDSIWGLKGFWTRPGASYSLAALGQLELLTRTGGVGIGAANVTLRAAGSLDLGRSDSGRGGLPLRLHLNFGYRFDNSGQLAESVESERSQAAGSSQRITRIERFGHQISRVDTVRAGAGVEGTFRHLRPFAEWSIDLPSNRQDYRCRPRARTPGDSCLMRVEQFSAFPSRLSLGARLYPWLVDWAQGVSVLVGFDLATGASSTFAEELVPEPTWMLHFGVGYAFDTAPRVTVRERTIEHVVRVSPPAPHEILGLVTDARTSEPVEDAVVRIEGVEQSALLTDAEGRFRTAPLEPGSYVLRISKDGYRSGQCRATLARSETGAQAGTEGGAHLTELRCPLEPLPQVAMVSGSVRDAATTLFVAGASVRITDVRGRHLTLTADQNGAFQFENVPAGKTRLRAEAPGYLPAVTEFELRPRNDMMAQLVLNRRPVPPTVGLARNRLVLKRPLRFLHETAELLPESRVVIEEIADLLGAHPELERLEIQGHTDDSGRSDHDLRLSEERARVVMEALILHGIDSARLSARGYGASQPLAPNDTAAGRAKNSRIELVVTAPASGKPQR